MLFVCYAASFVIPSRGLNSTRKGPSCQALSILIFPLLSLLMWIGKTLINSDKAFVFPGGRHGLPLGVGARIV
jgi:hypothetical protein